MPGLADGEGGGELGDQRDPERGEILRQQKGNHIKKKTNSMTKTKKSLQNDGETADCSDHKNQKQQKNLHLLQPINQSVSR